MENNTTSKDESRSDSCGSPCSGVWVTITTHELARQLLAMPNIPVCTPRVREYEDEGHCVEPVLFKATGENEDGAQQRMVIISHRPNDQGEGPMEAK